MIAAQFELLKCGHELLSSPFRVTVHGGKGPVILLSLPHSELPGSLRFPPNRGMAPRESPASAAREQSIAERRTTGSRELRHYMARGR